MNVCYAVWKSNMIILFILSAYVEEMEGLRLLILYLQGL